MLVPYLDEEIDVHVIAQQEKVIGEPLVRKMVSIASSANCSLLGRLCIKEVIMRQCVLGDRGYYENSLISLLITMQDDFVICRELILDMVERRLCRSREIIKIYAAKSIYLNAHDDATQKLLELIAEQ